MSQAVQPTMDRTALRVVVGIAFAAIVFVLTLLGSAAEACADGAQLTNLTTVHKIERVPLVPTTVASAAQDQVAAKLNQGKPCCGAGCHAYDAACGSSGCVAGIAAISLAPSSLFSPINSIGLSPFDQAKAVSAHLPPDLRPPRVAI